MQSSVLSTGGGQALMDPGDTLMLLLDHQTGLFQVVKDIPVAVEAVFDFIEGAMSAARIQNSLKPIQNMGRGAFMLLGLEWESKTTGAKA